jgi:hypothetical protein
MRSLLGIAAVAAIGSVALLGAELFRNLPGFEWPAADNDAYETTGSVGSINAPAGMLQLSDEQRERVHRAVMSFPDAVPQDARAPELADTLSRGQPMQDLPASVIEEIPLLHAHKVVKLDDRILLVDPASRRVVAMLPRYRLLP